MNTYSISLVKAMYRTVASRPLVRENSGVDEVCADQKPKHLFRPSLRFTNQRRSLSIHEYQSQGLLRDVSIVEDDDVFSR